MKVPATFTGAHSGNAARAVLQIRPQVLVGLLLIACASSTSVFLPDEGQYVVQWDNEPERSMTVTGKESRRRVTHAASSGCRESVLVWEASERGIVELNSDVVLLKDPYQVGDKWIVAGQNRDCHVERAIVAADAQFVEVEEYGVCRGVPLQQRTRSRWAVGRGIVRDDFGDGRWRTVTRVETRLDAGAQ